MKIAVLLPVLLLFTQVYVTNAVRPYCYRPPDINNGDYHFQKSDHCSESSGFDVYCIVRIICNPGYRVFGASQFVNCEFDGRFYRWSQVPTCEESHRCTVPNVKNGSVREHNNGEYITYSCDKGFELRGNSTRFCQDFTEWSGSPPVCEGNPVCKDGKKPGTLTNGNAIVTNGELAPNKQYRVGTELEYTCDSGHKMEGQRIRSCSATGKWTTNKPMCTAVLCLPLQNQTITNGWTDAQNRTYLMGETVNFYCLTGYRTIGKTWRACYENLSGETEWSDKTPTCEEIRCPRISGFEHGSVIVSNPSSRLPGTTVTFRCHRNYELKGPAEAVCKPNGKWSEISVCDTTDPDSRCPNPGILLNGFKVPSQSRYEWNDNVEFTCNAGFTLIGSAARVCNKTLGGWSGEQPTCQDPNDFDDIDDIIRRFVNKTSAIAEETAVDPNSTSSRGRFIDVTHKGGWNIYFVFDASNSVGEENFYKGINFAKSLVSKVGVGKARYGAAVFASNADVVFNVDDPYLTVKEVHKALDQSRQKLGSDIGGGTGTRTALKQVATEMVRNSLQDILIRPDAKSAVFLITDGKSNEGGSPVAEANLLKTDYNMAFHCIGVGADVDKEELANLASEPSYEHLFLMKDFEDIQELAIAVTNQNPNQPPDYTQCGRGISSSSHGHRGRIVGGNNAPDGAWPWMTGLYKQTLEAQQPIFFCGGSLIAPNWILTAAHCFPGDDSNQPAHFRVVLGSNERYNIHNKTEHQQVLRVADEGIIIHELYNPNKLPDYDYDIALLRLEESARLDRRVHTICIPEADNNEDLLKLGEGVKGFPFPHVTGWGSIEPRTEVDNLSNKPVRGSIVLQQLAVPLKGRKTCSKPLEQPSHFSSRMLCAGWKSGDETESGEIINKTGQRDACNGDSGGPLVRKRTMDDGEHFWYQIGLVSWGIGCAQGGQYGYYTHVPKLVDWIKNITNVG